MTLKKCKECGAEVSNKAKACPQCGSPVKKRTSLITWLVLIIIIAYFLGSFTSEKNSSQGIAEDDRGSNISVREPSKTTVTEKVTPKPTWTTSQSEDAMTGELSHYATSERVNSRQPMSFPYSDTNAWLGFGCDSSSEWVFVGFSSQPNLSNTDVKDGYNLINTRIKWGNDLEQTALTQKWGSSFLHFRNANQVIPRMLEAPSSMIELDWHGEGLVHFEVSLRGSSSAIQEARENCAR